MRPWVLLDTDIAVLRLVQLAAIAVMFRQTNVVWVIFVVCAGILDMLSSPMNSSTDVRKELTDIPSIDRTLRILATDLEDLKGVRRRRAAQNSSLSFISPDTEVKQKGPRKFESRGSSSCFLMTIYSYISSLHDQVSVQKIMSRGYD